jgi:zinc finger SWIM domain-containing protein 3
MGNAIKEVFTKASHGLCTYHIMQNVVKRLLTRKRKKTKNLISSQDLVLACIISRIKLAFEEAFNMMRNKVDEKKTSWLDNIYKFKEKWAEYHMRDVFTLGMRSTQLSESFNSDLKDHLKSDFDITEFLKHFERAVQGKRNKELDKEFEAIKKLRMRTPMLVQASKFYTPPIFEAFQAEYERSMPACTRALEEKNIYAIAIVRSDGDLSSEIERVVVGDPLEQKASYNCEQFAWTGVLCSHVLKVLDLMNIKLLPKHYVLKCWTREVWNYPRQQKKEHN